MAIIHEGKTTDKNSTKNKKYTQIINILSLITIVFISIIVIAILFNDELTSFLLPVLSIGVFILLAILLFNKHINSSYNTIEHVGEIGEQKALKIFSELDDDYTIFHNMNIYYNGKTSQLDNIMICKYGIFVIEIKNRNGHILGSYYDHEWIQEKTTYSGNTYESTFYNPVKQVNTHIYRLSNYLRIRGSHHYIHGIVFFVNEEVILDIDSDDIPIFDINNIEELFQYIESFPSDLSEKEQNRIFEILSAL
jgi:uncharacterized membrane protein